MKRLLLVLLLLAACGGYAPRDLSELVVEDSVYVVAETRMPYSGPVFRRFPDEAGRVQLEGTLLEGTWDGEMMVYHANGRIRYMGSFSEGERCGPWTENLDSLPPVNLYDELVRDIESMGIYPPCG
jgi:hypothetical protein